MPSRAARPALAAASAAALALALAAAPALAGHRAVAAAGARAATPTVAIAGTAVKDGVVTVTVRIANFTLLPGKIGKGPNTAGAGHWHLLVDGKTVGTSGTLSGRTPKLAAGAHRIQVELANNDHSSLAPPVRSGTASVTVAAGKKVSIPETTKPVMEDKPADPYGY